MSQTTFNPDAPRSLDSRVTESGVRDSRVTIEATRPRQTAVPASPFRDFLAGGVSVLMGGAQVATHVLGAPRLAAAIAGADSRATAAITSTPLGNRVVPGAPFGSPVPAAGPAGGAAALPAGTGSDSSDLATMQAMQRESQVFNMQLLELQEGVQQENRRFTTLSNVLRAKHDTAKAAVSNIRS